MTQRYSRNIPFEEILNFRDLGGYKVSGGRSIAWRRIFRSGEMHHMTNNDISRLKDDLKLKTIIDLRSTKTLEKTGIGPLQEVGVKYRSIPLMIKEELTSFSNSGEIEYHRTRLKEYGHGIVEVMEIIARPDNHPLVFHCSAGKDRSGIVAALLLNALGVADDDIITDYVITDRYMKEMNERWSSDPEWAEWYKNLPVYHHKAMPESMVLFLALLKKEYGSAEGYLIENGADASLIKRLEKALLR